MKFFILTPLLFLFTYFLSYCQADLKNIQFKSDFEKEVLSDISKHSELELLLAISKDITFEDSELVKAELINFKEKLVAKRFHKRNEKRKLKLLFELTHDTFFRKYRDVVNFDEIFSTSEYNCVSATALYAVILNDFDIPFLIKETPSHVFIVAYPKTNSIVLESTAPGSGYLTPSDRAVQNAVTSLIELKYFTAEEVQEKGTRKVYNDFFYTEGSIDIQKLAGLQYYNETIKFLQEENYKEALNSNYKSSLLYPSEKAEYLRFVILSNILDNSKFEEIDDVKYLAQYANDENANHENVVNTFGAIINDKLFTNGKTEQMDSIYHFLNSNLNDSTLSGRISAIYYEEYGRYFIQKSDFKRSMEFTKKAYEINPKNSNVQSMINHSILNIYAIQIGNSGLVDELQAYALEFPFLNENPNFHNVILHHYLKRAFQYIQVDNIKKGLEYQSLLEDLINEKGDKISVDNNAYGMIYAELGAAYYRAGEYVKAKNIINKGLKYVPEHPELKVRLDIVVKQMNR